MNASRLRRMMDDPCRSRTNQLSSFIAITTTASVYTVSTLRLCASFEPFTLVNTPLYGRASKFRGTHSPLSAAGSRNAGEEAALSPAASAGALAVVAMAVVAAAAGGTGAPL